MKAQAKEHESFRKICVSLAQKMHSTDVKLRMGLLGSSNAAKVRPLNEKQAIENGATFLSEAFIFSVAGGLILFESWRQRQKELNRRENIADDIKTLQYEIDYLKRKLKEYNVRLDDYVPPKDFKPSVLKHEVEDTIKEQVDKLNARVDALVEKKTPVDSNVTK